jgi:putative ABC transport system substrate-binding protein
LVLEGLRENGFVEGDNIIIERRFTAGRNDRAPEMVAELLQLQVELIAISGPSVLSPQSGQPPAFPSSC